MSTPFGTQIPDVSDIKTDNFEITIYFCSFSIL